MKCMKQVVLLSSLAWPQQLLWCEHVRRETAAEAKVTLKHHPPHPAWLGAAESVKLRTRKFPF